MFCLRLSSVDCYYTTNFHKISTDLHFIDLRFKDPNDDFPLRAHNNFYWVHVSLWSVSFVCRVVLLTVNSVLSYITHVCDPTITLYKQLFGDVKSTDFSWFYFWRKWVWNNTECIAFRKWEKGDWSIALQRLMGAFPESLHCYYPVR